MHSKVKSPAPFGMGGFNRRISPLERQSLSSLLIMEKEWNAVSMME